MKNLVAELCYRYKLHYHALLFLAPVEHKQLKHTYLRSGSLRFFMTGFLFLVVCNVLMQLFARLQRTFHNVSAPFCIRITVIFLIRYLSFEVFLVVYIHVSVSLFIFSIGNMIFFNLFVFYIQQCWQHLLF